MNELLDTFLDIPGMDKIRAHTHKTTDLKHMGVKAINSGAKELLEKAQNENRSTIWNNPAAVKAALNDTNGSKLPTNSKPHIPGLGFMTELQGYKGQHERKRSDIMENEFESSVDDPSFHTSEN